MPQLSIIIPFYNEKNTLKTISEHVFAACGEDAECIFVNDGSTDSSLQIAKSIARPCDQILTKTNEGKGSAVRLGIQYAKGKYTIIQDADLEYDPSDIARMLSYAEKNDLDVVFGSREMNGKRQYVHIAYYIGGVSLTWLFNKIYKTTLSDQPTCYKMVKTSILQSIGFRYNDFCFDIELTAALALRNISIVEIPISYTPRSRKEGKKIGWQDWVKSVWVLCKLRLQTSWAEHKSIENLLARELPNLA